MSIKIMSQVWESAQVSGSDLLVLLSLADHCNDLGECYPSIARLAKKCRLSERSVQYALKYLQGESLLSIQKNAGRNNTNVFTVMVQNMHRLGEEKVQDLQGAKSAPPIEKVQSTISKGCKVRQKGVQPIAPKPSLTKNKNLPDPRFTPIKDLIFRYYMKKNGEDPSWDPSEAKHLSEFLKATPNISIETFTKCLTNRFKSDISHSDRPRKWISNIMDFLNAPLDKYNRPLPTSIRASEMVNPEFDDYGRKRKEALEQVEREKNATN